MYFDESYFEEEMREGFFVHPMMKRVWAAELEVLEEIDRICKKHDLMYYAEWGTLLGAIRQHGFIPWDDDLDIGMKRKDYWKFIEIAKKEIKEPFEVIESSDKRFLQAMTRVVNGVNPRYDVDFLNQFHGCPYPLGIDIFPSDNIPDNDDDRKIFALMFGLINILGDSWDTDRFSDDEKNARLEQIEGLLGKKIVPSDGLSMSQYLIRLSEQVASTYYLDNTKYIGQTNLFSQFGYKVPAYLLKNTIEIPFENTVIPVPIGYDRILKTKYGNNYMIPLYNGGSHEYPFIRNHQDLFFDFWLKNYGEIPFKYRF